MEKTMKKREWRDNIIWVMIASTLVMFGGDILAALTLPVIPKEQAFLTTFMDYLAFWTMWAAVIFAVMVFKKNRYIKEHIVMNDSGNTFYNLTVGLLWGFLLNGLCALVAWFHGDISLSFVKFEVFPFLGLFFAVFVQSSAEEVLCRGFMYQRLLKSNSRPIVAIFINSLFFALFHLGNDGISVLAVYDLLVTGIFFSMVVYYFDSLWMAMGLHATWNFTQSILLGLPNSGTSFPYSVFKLNEGSLGSFAYDIAFGLEGTILSAGLMTVCCIVLYMWKGKDKNLFLPQE